MQLICDKGVHVVWSFSYCLVGYSTLSSWNIQYLQGSILSHAYECKKGNFFILLVSIAYWSNLEGVGYLQRWPYYLVYFRWCWDYLLACGMQQGGCHWTACSQLSMLCSLHVYTQTFGNQTAVVIFFFFMHSAYSPLLFHFICMRRTEFCCFRPVFLLLSKGLVLSLFECIWHDDGVLFYMSKC